MNSRIRPRVFAQSLLKLAETQSVAEVAAAGFEVLQRNGQVSKLPYVRAALRQLEEERGDIVVESSAELDESNWKSLTKEIESKYPGRTIRLEVHPELLGGFRLRIGSQLIDSSTALALRQLKKTLRATEVPNA